MVAAPDVAGVRVWPMVAAPVCCRREGAAEGVGEQLRLLLLPPM